MGDTTAETTPRRRVAVVSDATPERNGVGAYYVDLDHQLATRGVTMRSFYPGGATPEWLNLRLPGDSTQRLALPSPRLLARALKAFAPTSIIVPTPGPYGLLGAWLGRRLGARVIITFHTDYDRMMDLYWPGLAAAVTKGYFRVANRVLFRCGSQVLANSETVADRARAFGAQKVELLGTLIAAEFLDAAPTPVVRTLSHVLFVGRLAAEKNIEAVLEAAETLPELRFTVAGDGPQRRLVQEAAARLRNLDYVGWLSRSNARAAMDAADMLVLPSHVESFGTVALEAMARGRAVLVSPGCGIVEWPALTPGLFTMKPDESLTAALTRLARLPCEDFTTVPRRARAAALALNERTIDQWLSVLDGSWSDAALA